VTTTFLYFTMHPNILHGFFAPNCRFWARQRADLPARLRVVAATARKREVATAEAGKAAGLSAVALAKADAIFQHSLDENVRRNEQREERLPRDLHSLLHGL